MEFTADGDLGGEAWMTLTEMFANIKFELCLDQRLAEAAALRSAKERKES